MKLQALKRLSVTILLAAWTAHAAGVARAEPVPTWTSSPRVFITTWRFSPLWKSDIAAGATRWLSDRVPSETRPDELEALLPGSKPQLARFPFMILKQGEWSSLSFTGSADAFSGLVDESGAAPVLRLRVSLDGKVLPEVSVPLDGGLTGDGILLVGAPDGSAYAIGASVIVVPTAPPR